MATSLDKERSAIEAEEERLAARKKKLVEREQTERIKLIAKSVLAKLDQERLESLLAKMKALGVDEVEKRIEAAPVPQAA